MVIDHEVVEMCRDLGVGCPFEGLPFVYAEALRWTRDLSSVG